MERAKAKGSRMWKGMEEFINRKRKERDENRELILESEGSIITLFQ